MFKKLVNQNTVRSLSIYLKNTNTHMQNRCIGDVRSERVKQHWLNTQSLCERENMRKDREQPQRVNSARERQREREKENIINLFKHGEIIMKEKQISFIHCDFIVCKHGRLFVVVAKSNKTE